MKIKISLLLYALTLWVVSPVLAQNNGNNGNHGDGDNGHHYGHDKHSDKGGPGHGSDKSGPRDGSDKDDKGKKDKLKATTAEIVNALASGNFTTPSGAPIPVSTQGKIYAVLTRNGAASNAAPQVATVGADARATVLQALAYSLDRLSAPLAAAGPGAEAAIPPLVRSLSGLADNLDWLPTVITNYNVFVESASASFLADPPPEFLAMHAVLARLTAAAAGK